MMRNLQIKIKTASWFTHYVEAQKTAALQSAEQGAPVEFIKDQFESAVRSAAFDAVEVDFGDEKSNE